MKSKVFAVFMALSIWTGVASASPGLTSPGFQNEDTCPASIAQIEAKILKSASCQDANALAHACAYGYSANLTIAGAAIRVCEKGLTQMNRADRALRRKMEARCDQAYSDRHGTLYMSLNQFCRLSVVKFFDDFYVEDGDTEKAD